MNTTLKEETLGQRIRASRIMRNMTQEQLADIMCIPKTTLSAYENDKVDIKSSVLVELSRHLGTTPNYLLGMEPSDINNVVNLLNRINDSQVREAFMIQLEALAVKYS